MEKNLKWQVLPYKHADNGKTLIDYEHYQFGRKEIILYGLEAVGIVLFFAYFFYRSLWMVIPLMPVGVFVLKRKKKELSKKQQNTLKIQFKEAVLSISAGMRAGYSAENAFKEAYKDMVRMFGRQSLICRELAYLLGGMSNNIPIEKLLQSFGNRSGVEEIKEFGEIFEISKKNGGNIGQIIAQTVDIISRKLEVDREIETLISAKKLEQKIMNIVPFLILFYVDTTTKGFFDALYHNIAGNIIMTAGIAVYGIAICMEDKIMDIQV
ncbi:MAG: hypothetical protein IJN54_10970 [Lachnospiraceae bacterium]|nr:hypothetical protein [Lachnospiraceae bacterium]